MMPKERWVASFIGFMDELFVLSTVAVAICLFDCERGAKFLYGTV